MVLAKSLGSNWSATWLTGYSGLLVSKEVNILTDPGTLGFTGDMEKREIHPDLGMAGEIW